MLTCQPAPAGDDGKMTRRTAVTYTLPKALKRAVIAEPPLASGLVTKQAADTDAPTFTLVAPSEALPEASAQLVTARTRVSNRESVGNV